MALLIFSSVLALVAVALAVVPAAVIIAQDAWPRRASPRSTSRLVEGGPEASELPVAA